MKLKGIHIFVGILVLVVVATVVMGFLAVGSPEQARKDKLDQTRINDLQQITSAVDQYWNNTKQMPVTLADLSTQPNAYIPSLVDPKTGQAYQYSTTTDGNYQLCASFDTDTTTSSTRTPAAVPVGGPGNDFWKHPVGQKCFTVKVTTWPQTVK